MTAKINWVCISCGRELSGRKNNAIRHSKLVHAGDSSFYRTDFGRNITWHSYELEQTKGRLSINTKVPSYSNPFHSVLKSQKLSSKQGPIDDDLFNTIRERAEKEIENRLSKEFAEKLYPIRVAQLFNKMWKDLMSEIEKTSQPDFNQNTITPSSVPLLTNTASPPPETSRIDFPEKNIDVTRKSESSEVEETVFSTGRRNRSFSLP